MVTFGAAPAETGGVWWMWVLGGLAVWLVVAFAVGTLIGRGIRQADLRRAAAAAPAPALGTDGRLPVAVARLRSPRRRVPIPPIGIALLAIAVGLETVGYVTEWLGATGPLATALSMDAPFSVPRMYVAALFASAALAAVAGAGRIHGRRTWWLAVASVAGVIAAVKAGSTVHADALSALEGAVGRRSAFAMSASAALLVIVGLWFLSRTDRRDRRRVLGALTLYATAAVGLSALSTVVAGAGGRWVAAATYLEESGEALAGVGFLIAVLVGVAPRLVLPASWALRRADDALTLDVADELAIRRPGARGAPR